MAKYNYDKAGLKGLGVGAFLSEVKVRNAHIEAAEAIPPKSWYNPNELAKRLHPEVQYCIVKGVEDHGDAKSFTLVPDNERGTEEMAYFRAGQYVSVALSIDGALLNKPYTIRSNPKDALGKENTSYTLTVKRAPRAYASKHILDSWAEGSRVEISGPQGEFYYQGLRDAGEVIAIAGGSGITPFFSMACAIADGIEDFKLTILYGSRTADAILLKDELEAVAARSNGKVRVVHVLSHEEKEGFLHGFIDAKLIKKYAEGKDYSVFMCGPKPMYDFCVAECKKLGLKNRRIRVEVAGDAQANNQEENAKEYKLTVVIRGKKQVITAKSNQTLLVAMEQAGIAAPSRCRSGECGWCHSRLVSGEVNIPEDTDGRRLADKKFGWIHPCCTYPLGDVELEVYPTK